MVLMNMAKNTGYTKKANSSFNLLEKSIFQIFKANLAVKDNEKLLIVFDRNKKSLVDLFLKIGKLFTKSIDSIEIPVGDVNGEEPPEETAKKMLNYDVEILITTKSLTHTKARKDACAKGARIATLPNIMGGTLKRAIDIDYSKMQSLLNTLGNILDKGSKVKIASKKGTDLTFSIKSRKANGRESGLFTQRGDYGNLPDGEAFIAPLEGSADGICIIDGSVGSIGKVDSPITIIFKKGYAVKINGKSAAKKLNYLLDKAGPLSRNLAEFGIGTNYGAKIIGNMLEDEKVIGTCHIALGNNFGFGGKVKVPLHIDGLIKQPTIFVDGKKIMNNGRLTF